jgi:hypothetical protein
MKKTVTTFGNKVLLGQQLDSVGNGMKKPQGAKSEKIGSVGSDSILHQSTLLSFHPAEDEHKTHDEIEDEKCLGKVKKEIHGSHGQINSPKSSSSW